MEHRSKIWTSAVPGVHWENTSIRNNPNPNKDWCVHAQLTISHPTQSSNSEIANHTKHCVTNEYTNSSQSNNVHFEYSWQSNSAETVTEVVPNAAGIEKFESWPCRPQITTICRKIPDSGYNSEQISTPVHMNVFAEKTRSPKEYNRRCRSTCNITLNNNEPVNPSIESFKRCTSEERPIIITTTALRNAETQTESQRIAEINKLKQGPSRRQTVQVSTAKPLKTNYAQDSIRKTTRDLQLPSASARTSSPICLEEKTNSTSKPRTIHIDVYCTGSEDASTNTEDEDLSFGGSTSTPQTVYESPHYKILHRHKKSQPPAFLPGKSVSDNSQVNVKKSEKRNFGQASADPKFAETVKENKSRKSEKKEDILNSIGLKFSRNDSSSSALSSSYPSTFGETSRNLTEISLSSDVYSVPYGCEAGDSSNQYYENDECLRLRSLEGAAQHDQQWWMDYLFNKFSGETDKMKEDSDKSGVTTKNIDSESRTKKRLSLPGLEDYILKEHIIPPFLNAAANDPSRNYLDTASKFGSIVKSFRKPGHHITGPPKNPNCPCEHCKYYFEQKCRTSNFADIRTRTYSLGSTSNPFE